MQIGYAMLKNMALSLLFLSFEAFAGVTLSAPNAVGFKTAYKLFGSCSHLSMPSSDYAKLCGQNVFQLIYPSGRQSWVFIIRGKSLVSFSGIDGLNHPAAGMLKIDHVTLATDQPSTTDAESASGYCGIKLVASKIFEVKCVDRTASGDFSGEFVSDGSAPERQEF